MDVYSARKKVSTGKIMAQKKYNNKYLIQVICLLTLIEQTLIILYSLCLYSSTVSWTSSFTGGTTLYPKFKSLFSFFELNRITYGCFKQASAEGRFSGLKTRS